MYDNEDFLALDFVDSGLKKPIIVTRFEIDNFSVVLAYDAQGIPINSTIESLMSIASFNNLKIKLESIKKSECRYANQ